MGVVAKHSAFFNRLAKPLVVQENLRVAIDRGLIANLNCPQKRLKARIAHIRLSCHFLQRVVVAVKRLSVECDYVHSYTHVSLRSTLPTVLLPIPKSAAKSA